MFPEVLTRLIFIESKQLIKSNSHRISDFRRSEWFEISPQFACEFKVLKQYAVVVPDMVYDSWTELRLDRCCFISDVLRLLYELITFFSRPKPANQKNIFR